MLRTLSTGEKHTFSQSYYDSTQEVIGFLNGSEWPLSIPDLREYYKWLF